VDFDLPNRICLNRRKKFFIKIFNFGDVTLKVFFALSDASKCNFEKCCSINFAR
jgi:hypothetical protein